jgi:hypothetical protein
MAQEKSQCLIKTEDKGFFQKATLCKMKLLICLCPNLPYRKIIPSKIEKLLKQFCCLKKALK